MDEAVKMKNLKDDKYFNKVNKFITLQDQHRRKSNVLLEEVMDAMINTMRKQDKLFDYTYEKKMYGGSYYKGTRIGKPEEFDLDLILKLPVDYAQIKFVASRPGYCKIKIPPDSMKPSWKDHKALQQWTDNGYFLNHDEFRRWFYSVISKSFLQLPKHDNWSILTSAQDHQFKIKSRTSGPAVTLTATYNDISFDIDMVPVLEFKTKPNLPVFKKMSGEHPWHLVPKPLKDGESPHLQWRYCFYRYEQDLLSSKGRIKPIIRHLKKLRDRYDWSSTLPSYYIETLAYHELNEAEFSQNLDKHSSTQLLIHVLTKLKEALRKGAILYYWDPRHNLLAEKKPVQLQNVSGRMERILKDIEKDTKKLLEHFLSPEEMNELTKTDHHAPPSPQSEQLSDDSGILSPPLTCDGFGLTEDLINVPEPLQPPEDIKSMDQIAILARTVSILADEMKTFQSAITNEIRELKFMIQTQAQQNAMMQETIMMLLMEKRSLGQI